jgi:hypothetical protein
MDPLDLLLPATSARAEFTDRRSDSSKPLTWDRQKADEFFRYMDNLQVGDEAQTGTRPTVPRTAATTLRDPYYPPTPRAYYNPPESYAQKPPGGTANGQAR